MGSGEGACPSPDYRNKLLFVPTQHPIFSGFSVRVRVLGLGFCVRVRVLVSVTGSVSYLNYKFVLF